MAEERSGRLEVFKDESGRFRWRFLDARGRPVKLDPGTAPGVRRRKGYADIRKAVQTVLQERFEKQLSNGA